MLHIYFLPDQISREISFPKEELFMYIEDAFLRFDINQPKKQRMQRLLDEIFEA